MDVEEITPETWRAIQLEMPDSAGGTLHIHLLRPIWWIEEQGATVGGTIVLDMSEMGAFGKANVLSIGPCPVYSHAVPDGYHIVTGTFIHEHAKILDMQFEGEDVPLGVTANRPIWSVTQGKFLPAGELRVGDEVQTLHGTAKLLSVQKRPGRHTVYNLEVHRGHTYYVSTQGILVHNKAAHIDEPLSPTNVRNTTESPALKGSDYSPEKVQERQAQWQEFYGNTNEEIITKSNTWFDTIEKLNLEPNDPELPEEFKTDQWWLKRNL